MCYTPVFGTRQDINKELSATTGRNFTILFEFKILPKRELKYCPEVGQCDKYYSRISKVIC